MNARRIYVVVAACAAIAYIGALWNDFAWDDVYIISQNALVHASNGWWRAFASPYWPPEQGGYLYRPLTIATFVLDWHLDGPMLFHAVNIVWHVGAAVLVALLLERWSGDAGALVGGVLFAVHPVHVEAVANVVGRAELMAAVFTLLALYAAVEGRSLGWSTLAWIAGLLSKENAAVTPALIAVAWALGFGRPPRRRMLAFAAVWLIAGAGYAFVRWEVLHRYESFTAAVFDGEPLLKVRLTAVAELADVARLLVLPLKLRADYSPRERTLISTPLDGRFVAGVLALVAWGLWLILARRRRRPVETLGVAWIALAYAPVANLLVPTGVLVAERTLYLSTAGLALAVGSLASGLRGRLLWFVAGGTVALGGLRTALRVPVWKDNRSVVLSVLRDSPRSYVGPWILASLYVSEGNPRDGLRAAWRAIQMFPRDPQPFMVGAHAAMNLGQSTIARVLMDAVDSTCNSCAGAYRIEAYFARQRGDSVVAESLLAHEKRMAGR